MCEDRPVLTHLFPIMSAASDMDHSKHGETRNKIWGNALLAMLAYSMSPPEAQDEVLAKQNELARSLSGHFMHNGIIAVFSRLLQDRPWGPRNLVLGTNAFESCQ